MAILSTIIFVFGTVFFIIAWKQDDAKKVNKTLAKQ